MSADGSLLISLQLSVTAEESGRKFEVALGPWCVAPLPNVTVGLWLQTEAADSESEEHTSVPRLLCSRTSFGCFMLPSAQLQRHRYQFVRGRGMTVMQLSKAPAATLELILSFLDQLVTLDPKC